MSEEINATLLDESRVDLVELLRAEIQRDGRITFARFMQQALTHPQFGYYTAPSNPARPGFSGDFLTAPETDPIFGHALARQVAECYARLGGPTQFVVREFGGGGGVLARQLIDGLRNECPTMLPALRYELSDINAARAMHALEELRRAAPDVDVAIAGEAPITGLALANELLDAFPVHRLRVKDGALREIYVAWQAGWFVDELGDLSDGHLATPLSDLPLQEGQTLEVAPAAWTWARDLGAAD